MYVPTGMALTTTQKQEEHFEEKNKHLNHAASPIVIQSVLIKTRSYSLKSQKTLFQKFLSVL